MWSEGFSYCSDTDLLVFWRACLLVGMHKQEQTVQVIMLRVT